MPAEQRAQQPIKFCCWLCISWTKHTIDSYQEVEPGFLVVWSCKRHHTPQGPSPTSFSALNCKLFRSQWPAIYVCLHSTPPKPWSRRRTK